MSEYQITLGSLFDGSGGFPLVGAMNGIEPIWASEVKPYPIAVTKHHFPCMRHLGDVSKVRGDEIEPVDIITFGSPCQDMSIAGTRKGLLHTAAGDETTTRSGLFYEAVRIIKEMRDATDGKCPRFAVWENVYGAFSSNKGQDFRAVLEAFVHIKHPDISIPMPEKGKWKPAGDIVADGFSAVWRTMDAQFWGVPQRRKRIYLVADFATDRAKEVLFERKSLCGDTAQGDAAGQDASGDAVGGTGRSGGAGLREQDATDSVLCMKERAGKPGGGKGELIKENGAFTLQTSCEQSIAYIASFMGGQGSKAGGIGYSEDVSPTIKGVMSGGNTVPDVVYALQANGIDRSETAGCNGCGWREDKCYTLNTIDRHAVVYGIDPLSSNSMKSSNPNSGFYEMSVAKCLDTSDGNPAKNQGGQLIVQQMLLVTDGSGNGDGEIVSTLTGDHENRVSDYSHVVTFDRAAYNQGENAQYDFETQEGDKPVSTVVARGPSGVCVEDKTKDEPQRKYIVRRLTPLECNRLQGFPDGWGDIPTKQSMDEDELAFWRDVRRTWAEVQGKKHKSCGCDALIKWYNKLHTDSAEYEMWGNGIALPCAEFVMRGIVVQMRTEV